jgi:predicted nucleotidyltransferase
MSVAEVQKKIVPILKRRSIRRAGVFGSVARKEAVARDIDILVEMPRPYSLFTFLALKHELEQRLGAKVDLVEYSHIKPSLREHILASEVPIL